MACRLKSFFARRWWERKHVSIIIKHSWFAYWAYLPMFTFAGSHGLSSCVVALVINVRPSTNHASSTPPPEIQTQFLVWYPSLRLCCSPIGRSVLSGMSIQIHRSNSLANVFRAQQDKSQRIDLVCFLFLTRLFSPNASTASVISCLTPRHHYQSATNF